ncbi:MAG: hypothetical protein ACI4T1_00800 [Christensenellales bacterium]
MEDKIIDENYNKKLNKALIKRALGYSSKEVVEEFSKDKENLVLTKRKVTKKNIPPDISAVKVLLELYGNVNEYDLSKMTDEELLIERNKLLLRLKEENDN